MLFAAGVGHERGKSTTRNSILNKEMIIYFQFTLNKKNTSAAITVQGTCCPSPQEYNFRKGDIDFKFIPESEGDVGFNFRPKFQERVR